MSLRKTDIDSSPKAVVDAICQSITKKGLTLYSVIDHRSEIEEAAATPFTAYTITFGSPALSSMLLAKNIELSVDIPLRTSVVSRQNGCRLIWRDMHSLLSDFQIANSENTANLVNGIIEDVINGARAICDSSERQGDP